MVVKLREADEWKPVQRQRRPASPDARGAFLVNREVDWGSYSYTDDSLCQVAPDCPKCQLRRATQTTC